MFFDVAIHVCAVINVDVFVSAFMCVCALFGNSGTQHFISCQDGWRCTSRNERRGRIKQRSESMARQDGNRKNVYQVSLCL